MESTTKARRKFKVRLARKQEKSDPIPALLGQGNGTVVVPAQAGMSYYRAGNEESFGTVFNNRVPNTDNLPVFVGYDPVTDPDRRLFQVLSIRQTAYVDAGNTPIPNIGPHHETHEYGGGDDVFIEWRRLMGLRVGRPVAFVVEVDWGYIFRSGVWILAPVGVNTVDLTAEQAALVGTQAQMILVSLDDTGAIEQTNGVVVATPAALTIANCPVPPSGNIPLAAVRIYATQTAIGDAPSAPDIIDLRFPTYAAMSGGWDLVGNAGTTPGTNFVGTTDAQSIVFKTNSVELARMSHADGAILVGDSAHGLGGVGTSLGLVAIGAHRSICSVNYGTGNPAFAGFDANGTRALPTVSLSGNVLARFSGFGYLTAGWAAASNASVDVIADEDFGVVSGARLDFRTTPTGSTTIGIHGTLRRGQWDVLYDPANYFRVIAGAAIGAVPWTIPANAAGWLHNDSAGVLGWSTPTAANVGAWSLTGNALAGGEFLGSTNNFPLIFKANSLVIGWIGVPSAAAPNPNIDGNARGIGAVDFQTYREVATQVASGEYAALLGGKHNTASYYSCAVIAGYENTASGFYSVVCGGAANAASAESSIVLGGQYNTASGKYSAATGYSSTAAGDYSVACGRRAIIAAAHDGSFLFADHTNADFNSIAADEFAVRAVGGFRHAYDDGSYFTAKVADTTGVTTLTTEPVTGGFVFTPAVTFSSDVTLTTAKWLGLGAAAGRLTFDSSGAPDYAYFSDCYVGIGVLPAYPLTVNGQNISLDTGYSFFSGMYSGKDTVLGHNVYADTSSRVLKQSKTGYYATWIRMYYNEGIAFGTSTAAGTAGDTVCDPAGTTNEKVFITNAGNVGIGTAAPDTRLDIDAGAIEIAEMTAPAAGAANTVRIYAVDNGAGKTQLMALFSSGAAQQIAIQP